MRFFFDNCVSPRIVDALRALDDRPSAPELVHLRKRFRADDDDPVWLRALGREKGWVVVSGDPRISRGDVEKKAWHESGLTVFFFGDAWTNRHLYDQASQMIAVWRDIVREAKEAVRGSGFLIVAGRKKVRPIYAP